MSTSYLLLERWLNVATPRTSRPLPILQIRSFGFLINVVVAIHHHFAFLFVLRRILSSMPAREFVYLHAQGSAKNLVLVADSGTVTDAGKLLDAIQIQSLKK